MGLLKNVLYLKTIGKEYELISRVPRIPNGAEERRETKLKRPMCWVPANSKALVPQCTGAKHVHPSPGQQGGRAKHFQEDYLFLLNLDFP